MTVKEFADRAALSVICMPFPEKIVNGAYTCDLLSRAMVRAERSNVWITVMSNKNIVPIAVLCDISCILLAEDTRLDDAALKLAVSVGINILSSKKSSYECSVLTSDVIRDFERR